LNLSYGINFFLTIFILIYKILKLNLKNIIVNLKYLNSIKFWSNQLNWIQPNFSQRKLSLIGPNLGGGWLGQLRPRSIWPNLVKFLSGQLHLIRPILVGDDSMEFRQVNSVEFWLGLLGLISVRVNSTKFRLGWIRPKFGRTRPRWPRLNSIELVQTKFRPSSP